MSSTVSDTKPQKPWAVVEPNLKYYKSNLAVLEPEVVKALNSAPEEPIPTEDDVQVRGVNNPLCVVILGFGTSRVLDEILKMNKTISHIVVIEPNLNRFHATLKRHFCAHILDDKKIDFLLGVPDSEIQHHIYQAFTRFDPKDGSRAQTCLKPEIVPDPFVYSAKGVMGEVATKALTEKVLAASTSVFQSMGCASDTFNRWIQTQKNFETLQEAYSIDKAYNKFSDMPHIVVGAGPSMEEFIKVCKEKDLTKKACIIACDASLRRLLKEGIRPHFVTRCERKLTAIFDGVKKEDTDDIYYVSYPWCDVEFTKLFKNNIMVYRANGICNWSGYKHAELNGGVSSANAGLQLAYELGAKEIIITGIDLCFIDNASHVPGTKVEFDIEKSRPLWKEIKTNEDKIATQIPVWKRCHGEYENSILKYKRNRKLNVYNTSLKGAVIAGTTVKSWDDLSNTFKKDVFPIARLKKHLYKFNKKEKVAFEKRKKDAIDYLSQVLKDLKEVFAGLDDCLNNNLREEVKCMNQLKSQYEPKEYFRILGDVTKSLKEIYSSPAKVIDGFKGKHYNNALFTQLISDTLQLDIFKAENKVRSMKNVMPDEHERMKQYIFLHAQVFRLIEYYARETKALLEGQKMFLSWEKESDNSGTMSKPSGKFNCS